MGYMNTDLHILVPSLSMMLADAAAELRVRIDHGEFDGLDGPTLEDLESLETQLAHWARLAEVLQHKADGNLVASLAGAGVAPGPTDAGFRLSALN